MRKLFFLTLLLFIFASVRFAAADESYAAQFNQKFQSGVVNTLLGWSKILTVPYEKSSQDPNAWATFGRGIYEGVGDTFAGIYNAVFSPFPLPKLNYPGGGVLEG